MGLALTQVAWLVVSLSLAALVPGRAFAQNPAAQRLDEPTASDEARAQELFLEGRALFDEGRSAEALQRFAASLERFPTQAAAFNAALAATAAGEPLSAIGYLRRLTAGELGELSTERREQVEAARAEAEAQVASVTLDPREPDAVAVRIDGRERGVARGEAPLSVRVNPGTHALEATALGYVPFRRDLVLGPGDGREVALTLRPLGAAGAAFSAGGGEDPSRVQGDPGESVFESPWFWVVGGVVLLAGAGVGAYFLFRPDELPEGIIGQTEALRF